MTRIRDRKSRLSFETDETFRGRAIVVDAEPRIAWIRLKGTRRKYPISWEAIFNKAVQIEVVRIRQERGAARKARKNVKA